MTTRGKKNIHLIREVMLHPSPSLKIIQWKRNVNECPFVLGSGHDSCPYTQILCLSGMMCIAPLDLVLLQPVKRMLIMLRCLFGATMKNTGLRTSHRCTKYSTSISSAERVHCFENNSLSRFCSRLCFINTAYGRLDHRLLEGFLLPLLQALLLLNIGLQFFHRPSFPQSRFFDGEDSISLTSQLCSTAGTSALTTGFSF